MGKLHDNLRNVIEGQLSEGEPVRVEYTRESYGSYDDLRSTVVTDRRVIDATGSKRTFKDKVSIENIFFRDPDVCEVSYTEVNDYTFLQGIVRLFGGDVNNPGKKIHVVTVKTDESDSSFEFEDGGKEIAEAIATLAGENQA